jgi:hypothetical protein
MQRVMQVMMPLNHFPRSISDNSGFPRHGVKSCLDDTLSALYPVLVPLGECAGKGWDISFDGDFTFGVSS